MSDEVHGENDDDDDTWIMMKVMTMTNMWMEDSPLLALLGHSPVNEWPSKYRFIARQPCLVKSIFMCMSHPQMSEFEILSEQWHFHE